MTIIIFLLVNMYIICQSNILAVFFDELIFSDDNQHMFISILYNNNVKLIYNADYNAGDARMVTISLSLFIFFKDIFIHFKLHIFHFKLR